MRSHVHERISSFFLLQRSEMVAVVFVVAVALLGSLASVTAHPAIPSLHKDVRTSEFPVLNVVCPGGGNAQECPDGNTCCSVGKEKYACCPKSNAVCCPDQKHCCPEGYTCDSSGAECHKEDYPTEPVLQLSIFQQRPENVLCPGDELECPDGNTCCLNGTDTYGCCPKTNAVCCTDKKHCCPEGYTCDSVTGRCVALRLGHPLVEALAIRVGSPANTGMCPDDKEECPDNSTCCMMTTGDYGCCPKVRAVCCPDRKHCCPEGYRCNDSAVTCIKDTEPTPLLSSHPLPLPLLPLSGNIPCGNGQDYCSDQESCCLDPLNNKYSCCPGVDSVCCPGGLFCCPKGYTCDDVSLLCLGGTQDLPFLKPLPPNL